MADSQPPVLEAEDFPDEETLRALYRDALRDPEFAALRVADLNALTDEQRRTLPQADQDWLKAQTPPDWLHDQLLRQYDTWTQNNQARAERATGVAVKPPRRKGWFIPTWRDFGIAVPAAALGIAASLFIVPALQPPIPNGPDPTPFSTKGFDFGGGTSAQARLRHIADLLEKGETEAARQEWQAFRKAYPELLP